MQPKTFTKSEIHQAIDELSAESLAEVALFLEFLKFKDGIAGKTPPSHLGSNGKDAQGALIDQR